MIKRQLAILAVALTALLGLPALASTAWAAPAPAASAAPAKLGSCYPGSEHKAPMCKPKVTTSSSHTTPHHSAPSNSSSSQSSHSSHAATPANQSVLAFTGADVVVTLAVAGLLLAIGLVIIGLTRRRTA